MNKKVPGITLPLLWTPELMLGQGFAPLVLEWKAASEQGSDWDALLDVHGGNGETARFGALYQRDATPRQVAFSALQIGPRARRDNLLPLLLAPYLPEERLLELEQQGVSALDLCGNGVLRTPGSFLVFRTGCPNRFTSSRPLKNVYRGVSSMAARAFLLRPEYAEIGDLQKEIARRQGHVSLPTLSKALTEMEADMIVRRSRQETKPQARALRLLQPEKLLSRLSENYKPPKVTRSFVGKVALEPGELRMAVSEKAGAQNTRVIATGVGSASQYASIAMENTLYVYTSSLNTLLRDLPATETNRFPNLSVWQTDDSLVFFDPREDANGFPWASPITTYLEMIHGDTRLAQTAAQVREALLSAFTEDRS